MSRTRTSEKPRGVRFKCARPGCFTPMDPWLIEHGYTRHPTCEPDYPTEALPKESTK